MPREVKLHIADGDMVSWGPINNTFAWKSRKNSWQRPRDHWNGLLISLGRFKEFNKIEKRRIFTSVQFMNAAGQCITTLLPNRFTAINILSSREGRSEPVTREQMSKVPHLKRISFYPFASIMYWHDWGGYNITVREHYLASRLTLNYDFTFREVEEIVVRNVKKQVKLDLDDVRSIVVNTARKGLGPIGDKNDPPPNVP